MGASSQTVTLSPRQVALALGVSEATIKRWCDNEVIPARKTEGGHRRVSPGDVIAYARSRQYRVVRPDLLGLPDLSGPPVTTLEDIRPLMLDALVQGDEVAFSQLSYELYLSGRPVPEIFDDAIAPVFGEIGGLWEHGGLEVYKERRACEICLRWLHDLRSNLPVRRDSRALAIGGSLSEDTYALAPAMAEICLRDLGYRAESLGMNLPVDTFRAAIFEERPQLVWISVSHMFDEASFVSSYRKIFDAAESVSVPVALGGRALTDSVRRQVRYTTFCDGMKHLVDFANVVLRKS